MQILILIWKTMNSIDNIDIWRPNLVFTNYWRIGSVFWLDDQLDWINPFLILYESYWTHEDPMLIDFIIVYFDLTAYH